jgi:hypothetical protein
MEASWQCTQAATIPSNEFSFTSEDGLVIATHSLGLTVAKIASASSITSSGITSFRHTCETGRRRLSATTTLDL